MLFVPVIIYFAIFYYAPMFGIQIAFKNYSFRKGIWGSKWVEIGRASCRERV